MLSISRTTAEGCHVYYSLANCNGASACSVDTDSWSCYRFVVCSRAGGVSADAVGIIEIRALPCPSLLYLSAFPYVEKHECQPLD